MSFRKIYLDIDMIAIVIFLGFSVFTSFLSMDSVLSLKILFSGGFIPILVLSLVYRWVRTIKDINSIVFGILAVAIQTILYSMYQLSAYPSFFSNFSMETFNVIYSESPVTGLFYVPFVTASMLIGVIPLSAWYRRFGLYLNNTIWISLTIGAVFVAILTFSRGVWIAYIGALVLTTPLLFSKIRLRDIGLLIISMVLLYLIFTSEWAQNIFNFRISNEGSTTSTNVRLINYALVLKAIPNYFFIGLGLGQYPLIYKAFPLDPASLNIHLWFAHSLFLTLIPEIGFLGTLGFMHVFINGIKKGIFAIRGKWEGSRKKLIYAVIMSILFSLVIDSTSGNHLIAYLDFSNQSRTYFMAPEMIFVFAQLGLIKALTKKQSIFQTTKTA